jgi:hypothetical protein
MDSVQDDRFMVFLRFDNRHSKTSADAAEEPLATCSTYQEARRIRQLLHKAAAGECVIRYIGPTGGGD